MPEAVDTSATLPFLIAHPLERSRRVAASLEERSEALLWAAYQVVRLTGLLLLSDYLASPDECRKVNLALRALRAPDWWGWTVLCNQLVRFWSGELDEKPSRGPRLPRVASGWRSFNRKNASQKRESKWVTLLEGLAGRDGPAHSGNDALWHAFERRGRAAPGEQGPEAEQAALDRVERVVEAAAHRIFPAGSLLLVRRVGEPHAARGVVHLHGYQPDGRLPVQALTGPLAKGMGMLDCAAVVGDEVIPLLPMLLLFESEQARGPYAGGGFIEPLGVAGAGPSLVGVLGARDGLAPWLVGPAIDAFREKKIDMLARENEVSAAAVAPWAGVLLGSALRQLRERTYFADRYVERAGVDDALEAALQGAGRAVLVVGPSGAGKTSLLARLATRAARLGSALGQPISAGPSSMDFLNEVSEPVTSARRGGDIVLLLSGRGAYSMAMERSGPEMLADAVARKAGIKEKRFRSLADLCTALDEGGMRGDSRRLWLLLDGVDEAEQHPALLQALDQFLPTMARYPWLRLCVSLDEGSLRSSGVPFEHSRYFAQFHHPAGRAQVPYLACRAFTPDELAQAHAQRSARPGAPLPPPGAPAHAVLSWPLYLHLFTAGSAAAGGAMFDEEALFGGYLAALTASHPRLSEALVASGDGMLLHRSVDLLAAAVARSRRDAKSPPLFALVDAGLLLPPCDDGGDGEEAFVPVFAALTRELLLAALRRRVGGGWPDGATLLGWAHEALGRARRLDLSSPFVASLTQALEAATQRMVRAGHGDAVAALVEVEDDKLRQRLLVAALLTVSRAGRDDDRLVAALLSAATTPRASIRLATAAVAARRHLAEHDQIAAAAAIERFHLRALRARSDASSSVELQEAQGRSMVELASLLAQAGQPDKARHYASDAVRMLRSLGSTSTLLPLGTALRLTGALLPPERRATEGRPLLQEALEVLRTAESMEPPDARLQSEVAAALGALAEAALASGARDEAYARLTALVQARRRLAAIDPQRLDWQHELARSLGRLADLGVSAGALAEARRDLDEAATLLRAVVAREPRWREAQLDLGRTLGAQGNVARAQGLRGEGLRLLEEATEGLRWLQSQEPTRDDVRLDLAVALSRTGALLVMEGKRTRARRLLEEATGLLRDHWQRSHDTQVAAELASSLAGLGNLARVEGKQSEARQHFHEATRLWGSVVEADTRTDSLAQLAQSLWSSSLVETDPRERRRYVEKIPDLLDKIRERGPLSPALTRLAEVTARAIASLE